MLPVLYVQRLPFPPESPPAPPQPPRPSPASCWAWGELGAVQRGKPGGRGPRQASPGPGPSHWPDVSPVGSPDSRYIRVETCMFMIKLPQYSSLEIMLEKLRCAIHYREDPLSG